MRWGRGRCGLSPIAEGRIFPGCSAGHHCAWTDPTETPAQNKTSGVRSPALLTRRAEATVRRESIIKDLALESHVDPICTPCMNSRWTSVL